jgi:hypothetical protein
MKAINKIEDQTQNNDRDEQCCHESGLAMRLSVLYYNRFNNISGIFTLIGG